MRNVRTRLNEQGLKISLDDEVREYLINKGFKPEYGARPLRRTVEQEIEDALAEGLLRGDFKGKKVIGLRMEYFTRYKLHCSCGEENYTDWEQRAEGTDWEPGFRLDDDKGDYETKFGGCLAFSKMFMSGEIKAEAGGAQLSCNAKDCDNTVGGQMKPEIKGEIRFYFPEPEEPPVAEEAGESETGKAEVSEPSEPVSAASEDDDGS